MTSPLLYSANWNSSISKKAGDPILPLPVLYFKAVKVMHLIKRSELTFV